MLLSCAMDRWIGLVALRVSASDVAAALLRAGTGQDTVVLALPPRPDSAPASGFRALGNSAVESVVESVSDGGARLCVVRRAQALALVTAITRDPRVGRRLLDVAEPGLIPVLVLADDGVCVGVFDPRRADGGWDEGNAAAG
jgi:hypothetical protein